VKRALAAAVCLGFPLFAAAQGYPSKPIRSIMTVAGGADFIARSVARGLQDSMGQPVVVEIQSGAGGSIGAETVMRAAPDGHTIMLASASTVIMNGFLSKNSRFDPVKDFTPLARVAETVLLVVSSPALPVSTAGELIEYARRNPGKVSYGTSGVGTTHHLSAELIRSITGINWVHVPYKGGPPVLTDLMGGQIQAGFTILATATPFLASDKMRVLGVNNSKRYGGAIAKVPTLSEQIAGYDPPPSWSGYFAPAGLPQPIAARLSGEIIRIVNLPDVRAKLAEIGFAVDTGNPQELADTIRRDLATVARMVKAAGITPE
jgi:tripartite-type tricarboxylate transporter receptor subunit TctC